MPDEAAGDAQASACPGQPELILLHDVPEAFSILLQGGFELILPGPCTVREFLCELAGVCGDYAKKRIQTIFVNGKAVDDLDEAMLGPGSRLALSAALPGLVGATMRRGGFYGRLREGVTHHAQTESAAAPSKPFRLQIRLFNAVSRDLAEIFLKGGVIVSVTALKNFLASRPPQFFQSLRGASLNDSPLSIEPPGPSCWPLPEGVVTFKALKSP